MSPRRFNWQRPWALYSLLGLTLSLGVHALTYAGIDASRDMPLVWALHVGGMLAFLAMIIVGRPTRSPNGLLYFGLRRDEEGADQQPRGRRLTNDTHLSRRSH